MQCLGTWLVMPHGDITIPSYSCPPTASLYPGSEPIVLGKERKGGGGKDEEGRGELSYPRAMEIR